MTNYPASGRRITPEQIEGANGLSDEGSDAPLAPEIAEKVAPGAVCPLCKGGPLDGHVAGCARLAGELPLKLKREMVEKHWKVGDRVCFANNPLGQVYRVTRVHEDEPCVEVQNSAGLYASHLFVPAPAEPISLPPIELEARPRDSSEGQHPARAIVGANRPGHASPADPGADLSAPESPALGVGARLAYWLQHARSAGAPHVCIPCEAAEEILKLLGDR